MFFMCRGGSGISHWGGGTNPHWRGHQPLTQVLFGENICKNERIWSCWGGTHQKLLYVDLPLMWQFYWSSMAVEAPLAPIEGQNKYAGSKSTKVEVGRTRVN